jgi:hypothetical protein
MKYATLAFFLSGSLASAQTNAVISRQVMVQTEPPVSVGFAPPPGPPISVEAGADLKLLPVTPGSTYGPVQWKKDGNLLTGTGGTLEVSSASAGDSGLYQCTVVTNTKGDTAYGYSTIFVATHTTQRLLNFSTLATISPSQPAATVGFVVESGPGLSPVLVRGIGPTLQSFGLAAFLPQPSLELLDSQSKEVSPYGGPFAFPVGISSPWAMEAGDEAGAFRLLTGAADAAQFYYLPSGSYTARVGSVDGSSGTVLVEVYEAPFGIGD